MKGQRQFEALSMLHLINQKNISCDYCQLDTHARTHSRTHARTHELMQPYAMGQPAAFDIAQRTFRADVTWITTRRHDTSMPCISNTTANRFNKIAIPNNKFQMASGQGSHWLIESPTVFSSMCSPPLSNICQFYF